MRTTEILLNFRDLLAGAIGPLSQAGVTVGDEEWDDFVELTFEIAVSLPIERQTGHRIKRRYECWGHSAEPTPRIEVVLKEQLETLLIGVQAPGDFPTYPYTQQAPKPEYQTFVFRQFGHPFEVQGSKAWMDSVWGEFPPDAAEEAQSKRICVPVQFCEFRLGMGL